MLLQSMMKIGEWQCVVEFFALLAYPSFLAEEIGNKNLRWKSIKHCWYIEPRNREKSLTLI